MIGLQVLGLLFLWTFKKIGVGMPWLDNIDYRESLSTWIGQLYYTAWYGDKSKLLNYSPLALIVSVGPHAVAPINVSVLHAEKLWISMQHGEVGNGPGGKATSPLHGIIQYMENLPHP